MGKLYGIIDEGYLADRWQVEDYVNPSHLGHTTESVKGASHAGANV